MLSTFFLVLMKRFKMNSEPLKQVATLSNNISRSTVANKALKGVLYASYYVQ